LRRIQGVSELISQAIDSQDKLGLESFLEGGFSKYWPAVQEEYILYSALPRPSRPWATFLILKLFNMTWD
jgi:hypothetical protein